MSRLNKILLLITLAALASAAPSRALAIENLLNCNSIRECILNAIDNLLFIVVGVTVLVIIIAGLMYIFSGANQQLAERAKNAFVGACLGFVIVIGAEILINQVGCALDWKNAADCEGAHGIVARTITFLFSILGDLGIGGILVGAIYYFASAGDEETSKKGRKIFISSIIGTAIALLAVVIVRQVEKFF